jgi:hypothetical protein
MSKRKHGQRTFSSGLDRARMLGVGLLRMLGLEERGKHAGGRASYRGEGTTHLAERRLRARCKARREMARESRRRNRT